MDTTTFEKERDLCRMLSRHNQGSCNWGRCAGCGVIPLLYKLHHGKVLETKEEIQQVRDDLFL